jgi:hypothetical protein
MFSASPCRQMVDARMVLHATLLPESFLPQAFSSLEPRLAQLAGRWFVLSGIQDPSGGVARYYHSDTGRNARTSTEITGYAISALLFLYERHQDKQFLEAAQRAGDFLIETAWSPSLRTFPFEHAISGDAPQPLSYFFDCGIIVRGLLALWRVTGTPEYLDVAVKTGESMKVDFAAGDTWHPILELPGKHPLQWTAQWSRRPGCYQLKSALGWHDLHQLTGEEKFAKYYAAAAAKALATKDEFLPAETREKTMDRLHAYCYFLEALLAGSIAREARQIIAEGILRVSGYLREIRPDFERSDVYAQLLRVRLIASATLSLPLNESEAVEEASAIESFQVDQPGVSHHGGFWFGRKNGQMLPYINPVSTAFCMQAYEWWQDHLAGKPIQQAVI